MLLGLSQMLQKGFLGGLGRAKQEDRKGGKSLGYQGFPLLTTMKNIMYTSHLRPGTRNCHNLCFNSSKYMDLVSERINRYTLSQEALNSLLKFQISHPV